MNLFHFFMIKSFTQDVCFIILIILLIINLKFKSLLTTQFNKSVVNLTFLLLQSFLNFYDSYKSV